MSGWKTATIKTESEAELTKQINHLDNEKENFKKLGATSFGMGGYDVDIKQTIAELLTEVDVRKGDEILIIEANNTTDSGSGYLYEIKSTNSLEVEDKDEKHGYEGARARDVVGYFRENHGISGFSHVH